MPLLTVRLNDEEYGALKDLAGTGTMADLVRGWIAGDRDVARETQTVTSIAASVTSVSHEACDRRIAELDDAVRRAKARYDPLLGVCMSIYAATARQKDTRQFIIYEDIVTRLRAIVDEEAAF